MTPQAQRSLLYNSRRAGEQGTLTHPNINHAPTLNPDPTLSQTPTLIYLPPPTPPPPPYPHPYGLTRGK